MAHHESKGPNKWRCHFTTSGGETHSAEGCTKEEAKGAALEISEETE